MVNQLEVMEKEKFFEYILGKRISDRNNKRLLSGSYKEEGSDKIFTGDEFMAYEFSKCSALEVYGCYIKYFNRTIQREDEKNRIPVSAEWIEDI